MRERRGDALEVWMTEAAPSGIEALARFAQGLREDLAAITAGLTLPWSNGPVEGHVNRLKLLKRQGYGRAGFALLRRRVLLQRSEVRVDTPRRPPRRLVCPRADSRGRTLEHS